MSHPAVRDGAHPLAGAHGVREPLWRVAGLPALAVTVALLATANRYELHGDELYFRMLPPAWWYDDQPPLTVWLSHLGAALGHDPLLQRLPAIAAVACSVLLAACFPRLLLGDDPAARVAAWAHAFTVYPLLMGHVFLTSSLDLVAWQAVVRLTLIALRDHERGLRPRALVWAGVVAGLACWNKLLVVVLLAALAVAVLAADAAVLRTREALSAAVAFVALSAPQLGAQLLHGLPMSRVSGRLIAEHGALNRLLILPLLVAFLGPPMVGVWWHGLRWRRSGTVRTTGASATSAASRARRSRLPVLAVTTAAIVAWNLALPAQPYYAVAAVLPALALGWGAAHRAGAPSWQLRRRIVAGNAAVAVLLCLPVLPVGTAAYDAVAAAVPVARDQVGWREAVHRIAAARGGRDVTVVADHYALAGALAYDGPAVGIDRAHIASGHNALWSLGPPATDDVLLVGSIAQTHRYFFRTCEDAGRLALTQSDPFGLGDAPMARCSGLVADWATLWPEFRRLGG